MDFLFSPLLKHVFYPVIIISLLYFMTQKCSHIIIKHNQWRLFVGISALGTFVHEASHALVGGLFGHHIVAFKPFLFDRESGTMGYVQTSYRKNSHLNMIGGFFMAIAPLFIGTLLIYGLLKITVPNAPEVVRYIVYIADNLGSFQIESLEKGIVAVGYLAGSFFSLGNLLSPLFWLFVIVSFSIAICLVPSMTDFRSMVPGIVGLGVLIIIISASEKLVILERYFFWVGSMLNAMLTLTLMFTLFYTAATFIAAATLPIVYKTIQRTDR
jgi:hypothetical protein